jgi:aminopeptidase YwaD
MTAPRLSEKAQRYLKHLCLDIPNRRVGSSGNRAATDFFAGVVASFDFATESPVFDCIDWIQEGARLTVDGAPFEVLVSPYSLGGRVSAPLVVASTVDELEALEPSGKVLLLRGEIAKEQLMPKDFPFYNPDHHQHIVHLLETKGPRAIVAATSRDPALAGGVYPFPLIEDGDFDIPSVYMTEDEGQRLARHAGREVSLEIVARRSPATGCNVYAHKGAGPERRVVVCAHIDAKDNTPGAIDNAGGTVVLLLLAELLAEYTGSLGIEIIALNGEDYYSAPGQKEFVLRNAAKFDQVILGINLDGPGYYQGATAYSTYDCPADIAASIHRTFSARKDMSEGEPWYQSDHSIFLQNARPALAITSDQFMELSTHLTHTPRDSLDIVDSAKLVNIAEALRDLLLDLDSLR